MNLEIIKKQKLLNDFANINKILNKKKRWDNFRDRKKQAIDDFINVKRR